MIKNNIRRVLCLLVIFSCAFMSSCGGSQGKPAMTLTYGDNTTTFSSNIYSYYLSYMKTTLLLTEYSNIYRQMGMSLSEADVAELPDNPDYWTSAHPYYEGVTYGDIAKFQAEDTIKQILAIAAYCKEKNLRLSNEEIKNIDNSVKEIIKDFYGNSKSRFNAALLKYDINEAIFKEIKRYESLTGVFNRYLFNADEGQKPITDDMINMIYDETCVRVKHILIPFSPGTRDADGNDIEYTEEELAEKKAYAEDLYNRITGGEDFDSLLSESSDGMPFDGYTFSEDSGFAQEFADAAFDMKIGDVRKVETVFGLHIIKKYELLPAEQTLDLNTGDTWRSSILKQIQAYFMAEELQPYIEKIEVHKSETNLFDILTSAVMFDSLELIY